MELFRDESSLRPITGPIRFAHTWVDSATVKVNYTNEYTGEQHDNIGLCLAGLGYSYVGVDPEEWPFWDDIRDIIKRPSDEMIACQQ